MRVREKEQDKLLLSDLHKETERKKALEEAMEEMKERVRKVSNETNYSISRVNIMHTIVEPFLVLPLTV